VSQDVYGDLMANNLLMLIKLDADTMAFASLLVSIVGAVAAILAAFYANIAAFYAKKAATKRDLARVEQSTQYVEHFSNKILSIDTPIHPQEKQEDPQAQAQQEPSQPQAERKISPAQQEASPTQVERKASQGQREASPVQAQQEASEAQPQRIPISVEGEAMGEVPLELFLTLQDSSVRVSRVERLGKAGKPLGSSPCKATDNALVFKSILATEKVTQWWNAGESTSEGEPKNVLRVYLLLDEGGREVYRDIPVSIVNGLRNVGIATLVVWTVKGSI
jgi:flagellar biosynthesis GTPase FlhF